MVAEGVGEGDGREYGWRMPIKNVPIVAKTLAIRFMRLV